MKGFSRGSKSRCPAIRDLRQRATRAAERYLELRMPDEAWEELESLEPDLRANPDVLAMRVRIFLAKEMLPSAVITTEGLVCVVPWSMPARELAAQVLERWGRFDAALAMFEGAPPEVKKDAVHFFHEGRLLVAPGSSAGGLCAAHACRGAGQGDPGARPR